MIRLSMPEDIDRIMALWLASSIQGHPFIDRQYWLDSWEVVRSEYIPRAQTWLYIDESDRRLLGFISVIELQFIGALFVCPTAQRHGVGSALINQVKRRFSTLSLEVYQDNESACLFYERHGFRYISQSFNQDTQLKTSVMMWMDE